MMNIYVGNLSYGMTDEKLTKMFEAYGTVESTKIIKDNYSGRSKGFGFVEMPDNAEADQAIKGLNGKDVEGRAMKVNQADAGGKKQKRTNRRRY